MIRSWIRAVGGAWERFWFHEIPGEIYSVLRITFGILGLVSLLGLTPISMYWPLESIAPVPGQGLGLRLLLLNLGLGTIAGWTVFCGLFLAFACMTIGYRTGQAVLACLIGSVVQIYWNHLPLSSAFQVLIVVLFCLMLADSGTSLSLDAWIKSRRHRGRTASPESSQPVWPLRLIRYQVALVYLNSGLWKLFGPTWRDGSALYFALENNIFRRFPKLVPPGWEWIFTLATYTTLVWEIAFAFMLLHPSTRKVALASGVLIHVGVWATMEVGPFSWLMIASYIAFIDPDRLARFVRDNQAKLYASMPGRPAR